MNSELCFHLIEYYFFFRGAAYVADVAVISKHDKFVLGGKRLIFYDNSAVSKSIKNFNDDICAVSVDYNVYYNWFVVLTK